jgi:hypothetical protein
MNMNEWVLIGVFLLLVSLCVSAFRSTDFRKRRR